MASGRRHNVAGGHRYTPQAPAEWNTSAYICSTCGTDTHLRTSAASTEWEHRCMDSSRLQRTPIIHRRVVNPVSMVALAFTNATSPALSAAAAHDLMQENRNADSSARATRCAARSDNFVVHSSPEGTHNRLLLSSIGCVHRTPSAFDDVDSRPSLRHTYTPICNSSQPCGAPLASGTANDHHSPLTQMGWMTPSVRSDYTSSAPATPGKCQ